MSNNISADTLFHFMKKPEYLFDVLEKKFSPRYYKEYLEPFFDKKNLYIAMKCFCDIPLALVQSHSKKYGRYSIGFSKEWGIKNSLNPVTYYNKDSDFINSIKIAYNSNVHNINIIEQELLKSKENIFFDDKFENMIQNFLNMQKAFLNFKPYKGRMWDGNEWLDGQVFYNEREWRLLIKPNRQKEYKKRIFQYYYEDQTDKTEIEKMNIHLARYRRIKFNYEDINFIILNNKSEISETCKIIDGLKIETNKKDILKTKILIYDDIDKNF